MVKIRVVGLSGYGASLHSFTGSVDVKTLRRKIRILHAPVYSSCGQKLCNEDACPLSVWIFEPPSLFERLPDEILAVIFKALQHYKDGASLASSMVLQSRRLFYSASLRDCITIAHFSMGWGPSSGGGRCMSKTCSSKQCDSNMLRVSRIFPHVRYVSVRTSGTVAAPGVMWIKVIAEAFQRWTELDEVNLKEVLLLPGSSGKGGSLVPTERDMPPLALFKSCQRITAGSAVKTACMSLALLETIGASLKHGNLRSLRLDSVEARRLRNPMATWDAACLTDLSLGTSVSEFVGNEVLLSLQRQRGTSNLRCLEFSCGNRPAPFTALGRLRVPNLTVLSLAEWPAHSMRWRDSLQEMLEASGAQLSTLRVHSSALMCFELSRIVRACQNATEELEHLDLTGSLVGGCDLVLSLSRLKTVRTLVAPSVQRLRSNFPVGLVLLSDVRVGESMVPAPWADKSQLGQFIESLVRRCPSLSSVEFNAPERSRSEVGGIESTLREARLALATVNWRGGGVSFSSGFK